MVWISRKQTTKLLINFYSASYFTGEHTATTESVISSSPTTNNDPDADVYTGWSTAAPVNTDMWDAIPTADVTETHTHRPAVPISTTSTTSTHSSPTALNNKTKSTQSTDLSDIHFQPKHKMEFDKSVFHQELPHDHFDTNALEQFIKGDPMDSLQHEESHRKHSSISPSPYSFSHPSRASKHSRISESSSASSHANGSRNFETTDPQSTETETQRGNTRDNSDLGEGYTSSFQEEDVVTETVKSLKETDADISKNSQKEDHRNNVNKDRAEDLKSQVHRVTQDDDGEYEYGEQVLDEVDTYDDNDEVTQGNIVEKHTNNQTSVQDDTKDQVGRNNSVNASKDQEQSTKGKFIFVIFKIKSNLEIILAIAEIIYCMRKKYFRDLGRET